MFCTKHDEIPALMYEIGRQREITSEKLEKEATRALTSTFDKNV